jgi:hypothetical protein
MGASDLEQFIQQPFVGAMLGLMCFFLVLLLVVVALLIFVRRRRNHPFAPVSASPAALHDMPDLSLLVNTPAPAPANRPAPAAPQAVPPAPPPTRTARQGTYRVPVRDGGAAEVVEVLTILRDVVDGRLVVQMGDKAYRNVNSDPEFRDRFTRLMRELAQVASKPAAPASESPAASPASAPPPLETTPPPAIPPPQSAPRRTVPPPDPGASAPGLLPSFKLEDNPLQKRRRGEKFEPKPVPEINIAGAIESYLQHKLYLTGEFAGRTIHIYPAPDGGVSIEVDGQYFDSVADVSDAAVRNFLSETIQEWQDRH